MDSLQSVYMYQIKHYIRKGEREGCDICNPEWIGIIKRYNNLRARMDLKQDVKLADIQKLQDDILTEIY